jgi:hypothetical protein
MANMRLLLCVLLLSSAACGRQEEAPWAASNAAASSTPTTSPGSLTYTTAGGLRFADAAAWQEVPEGQRRKDMPQPDGTTITIHSNWFYRGAPDAPETLLNLAVTDISAADAGLTLEAWTEKFKQERPGDEACEIVDLSGRRRALCKAVTQYKGKDFQALMYRWIDGSKLVTVMYLFSKEPDRAAADAVIGTIAQAAR